MIQYRLLRSNKETGPYTAEQLIKLGLKAYDLIWTEGRSAAWRYPSEIEELKAFAPAVEEQPFDRFYKKPQPIQPKKEKPVEAAVPSISKNLPSITVIPSFEQPTAPKQKPRIRIKADLQRIEILPETPQVKETFQPESARQTAFSQNAISRKVPTEISREVPSWKDAWLDWEQEKKAVTAVTKNEIPLAPEEKEPILETKFSQSFDDIKEKYVQTILNAKSKKVNIGWNKYKAYISLALICLPFIGFGIWLGFKWSGPDLNRDAISKEQQEKSNPILPAQSVAVNDQEQIQPSNTNNETAVDKKAVGTAKLPSAKNISHPQVNIVPKKNPQIQNSQKQSQTQTKKDLESNTTFQPPITEKHHSLVINNPNTTPSRVANRRSTTPTDNTESSQDNNIASNNVASNHKEDAPAPIPFHRKVSKPENIEDYVRVNAINQSSPNGVPRVTLQVQNISDIPVDMIVMDLQYFDAYGKYKKGETIYIRNIPASETVNIKAPDDKFSAKLTYKVSMISAEQKGVYLISD